MRLCPAKIAKYRIRPRHYSFFSFLLIPSLTLRRERPAGRERETGVTCSPSSLISGRLNTPIFDSQRSFNAQSALKIRSKHRFSGYGPSSREAHHHRRRRSVYSGCGYLSF